MSLTEGRNHRDTENTEEKTVTVHDTSFNLPLFLDRYSL
jgi:hypothetical protein